MRHAPRIGPPSRDGALARRIVAGARYRVSCVRAHYPGNTERTRWWPVLAQWHEDWAIFGFRYWHFHIDWRFVGPVLREETAARLGALGGGLAAAIITSERIAPLGWRGARTWFEPTEGGAGLPPVPARTWCARKERTAWRAAPERWGAPRKGSARRVRAALESAMGRRRLERHGDGKIVCPHRGADLSAIAPDAEGRIECPGHGLTWCVVSDRVVSSTPAKHWGRAR